MKTFKVVGKILSVSILIGIAIIGIPIGAPMWVPALFGMGKD